MCTMDQHQKSEARRLVLHNQLKQITPNCYYTPLEQFKMVYPCIVYTETSPDVHYANNQRYLINSAYTVTVISRNSVEASELQDAVVDAFMYCKVQTSFVLDNLYHKVLYIYL